MYNVAQTNLAEVQPERMQKLMDRFRLPELRDTEGMYAHAALDRMVETQGWVCPIQADKRVDGAYYSPSHDIVVVPMKAQFNTGGTPEETYRGGMEYYSTMLHEMAHSTMTPERLNRDGMGRFGDPKYAKEELVAELTAAMISHSMGFDQKVTDNSAAYLDSWIGVLKQEPKFIVSVMADVNRASDMILDHVDRQRLALNEQPYLAKNDPFVPLDPNEEVPFRNAAIVKTRGGDYAIRASYDGVELGLKKVSLPAYGLQGQGGLPEHDGTQDIRAGDCHDGQDAGCKRQDEYLILTIIRYAGLQGKLQGTQSACRRDRCGLRPRLPP